MLAGSLALIALHRVVAYRGPSQRLAELAGPNGLAVRFVNAFLWPTHPAIPERGASSSPTSSGRVSTPPSPNQVEHRPTGTAPSPNQVEHGYPAPAPR
jgi:hypothetical protein